MSRKSEKGMRVERVSEQIRADVADILQHDIKDPRASRATCTRVQVSTDLRHARVYISVLGDKEEQEDTFNALQRAAGFVRWQLSRRLVLRNSPEIVFVYDPAVEYGIRLESLLKESRAMLSEEEEQGD